MNHVTLLRPLIGLALAISALSGAPGAVSRAQAQAADIPTVRLYQSLASQMGAAGSSAAFHLGSGAWRSNGQPVELVLNLGAAPYNLAGITLADIASISYHTRNNDTEQVDWSLVIYTTGSDHGDGGETLVGEPQFAASWNAPEDSWNAWSTVAGPNQLTFYDEYHSLKVGYGLPVLETLQAGEFDWMYLHDPSKPPQVINYSTQLVERIGFRTSAEWASAFDGYLDDIQISLKDGRSLLVDLESLTASAYVNASWANVPAGTDPDGSGPAVMMGSDAFSSLAAGAAALSSGGTLRVATGQYAGAITLDRPVSIEGTAGVILQGGIEVLESAPGVTIRDVEISAGAGLGGEWQGIRAAGANLSLLNVRVTGVTPVAPFTGAAGINAGPGAAGLYLDGVTLSNNWTGLVLNAVNGVTIRNSLIAFNNGGGVGIVSNDIRNVVFENSTISDHNNDGWTVSGQVENVLARGSKFLGNTRQISTSALSGVINAASNWWGQESGPIAGRVGAGVDVSPYCSNAGCTMFGSDETLLNGQTIHLDSDNNGVAEVSGSYASAAGGSLQVKMWQYISNPEDSLGALLATGAGFYDVQALNSTDSEATLTVTLPAPAGTLLRFWDGSRWAVVVSNNGTIPVTTAGQTAVVFGAQSTPRLSQLTGTPVTPAQRDTVWVEFSTNNVQQNQPVTAAVYGRSTGLWGVEVHLAFDAARLQVTNVSLGGGLSPDVTNLAQQDNGSGLISFSYTQLNNLGRQPVIGDRILLATITFSGGSTTGSASVGFNAAQPTLFSSNQGGLLGTTAEPSSLEARPASITVNPETRLNGSAYLQGRSDHTGVKLTLSGVGTRSNTTSRSGAYNLVGLLRGTYNITASYPGYLPAAQSRQLEFGGNSLPPITLLGGNAVRDGKIDLQDLSYISSRFLLSNQAYADINSDGVVNILDLTLAGVNYNKNASGW